MKEITSRQSEVLNFIRAYHRSHGYPPTRRNITDEFGFRSPNAAEEHLRALDRKGYITLQRNTSRGIVINGFAGEHLPIIGRVAAGSPILAEENIESDSTILGDMFDPSADYLLRVQGESMINAGIFHGDLLAIHRTYEAHDNQIVVARLAAEITVKRFKLDRTTRFDRANRDILLVPENQEYQTIRVSESNREFQIEGVSVGLIRMRM